MVFGYVLALALSVIDFLTEGLFSKASPNKMKFISFSAGVSVAYIFLVLLPEIYSGAITINRLIFLSILFGFAIFHIIEKYIRQNFTGPALRKEHKLIHSATSFIYFFMVGFLLVKVTGTNILNGTLLFIPIMLHIIIDSLPRRATKKRHLRALHASSAFLGAVSATFIEIGNAGNVVLLGAVGGALLYTVVRESLPKERKGKPMYFITGLLLFTVVILLLWNVGF
jgi:zinc transporter ZupT